MILLPMKMSFELQWKAEERYMGSSKSSSATTGGGAWSITSGWKVMPRPTSARVEREGQIRAIRWASGRDDTNTLSRCCRSRSQRPVYANCEADNAHTSDDRAVKKVSCRAEMRSFEKPPGGGGTLRRCSPRCRPKSSVRRSARPTKRHEGPLGKFERVSERSAMARRGLTRTLVPRGTSPKRAIDGNGGQRSAQRR